METITLVIADDHPLFISGVRQTFAIHDRIRIVGEAADGREALMLIKSENPDIAVLDVRMPGKSGMDVLAELDAEKSGTRAILLTMYKNRNYFYQAVSLGVKGYVLKESAVNDLIDAVETVARGGVFVSGAFSRFLDSERKSPKERRDLVDSVASLTPAEKRVLKLVGQWKSNHEIADALFISPRTASTHRTHIADKLNLHGPHSLIRFAIENRELF